tara:strand:- start:366 stop:797 length:432 start_codon:yes stop_codon:yes gene_type:complete
VIQNLKITNFSIILVTAAFSILSCSNQGTIHGGTYKDQEGNKVSAFYIYDYVARNDIEKHSVDALNGKNFHFSHFYFSHNSNIPTHLIEFSENMDNTLEILNRNINNLKFVSINNEDGKIKIINCSKNPLDKWCQPINHKEKY